MIRVPVRTTLLQPETEEDYDFGPDFTEEEYRIIDCQIAAAENLPALNLSELPEDILFAIFYFCDFTSLIAISSTCKRLREVSTYDDLWRKLFERDFSGTKVPHATIKQLQDIVVVRLQYDRIGKMIDSKLSIKGCPWKEIYIQYRGTGHLLSREQQAALEAVKSGKNLMLTGCAGTGKSYLIGAIRSELKRRKKNVAVCASTGLAAFNIDGQTIHSWAGIGRGETDADWRKCWGRKESWREVEVLILDEVSMLSDVFLSRFDDTARQLRGVYDLPFGGIQVILSGDFCQLPPVPVRTSSTPKSTPNSQGSPSSYPSSTATPPMPTAPPPKVSYCFESATFKAAFEDPKYGCIVNLTRVFRQEEAQWVTALSELRLGKVTPTATQLLKSRSVPLDMTDGIVPTIIYPTNAEVDHENKTKLAVLEGETYLYTAGDSIAVDTEKMVTPKDQREAEENLRENVKVITTRVHSTLELKVGAQVILVRNMSRRLVNGSRGVVVGFQTIPPVQQDPEYWSDFGMTLYHPPLVEQFFALQPLIPLVKFTTETRLVFPIPFTMKRTAGEAVRLQLPLKLGWACTVHGAQGMTLDKAQISIANCFEYGQIYSALSRVRTLNGLFLKDLPYKFAKLADQRVLDWYNRIPKVSTPTPSMPLITTPVSAHIILESEARQAQRARAEATRQSLQELGHVSPAKKPKPSQS